MSLEIERHLQVIKLRVVRQEERKQSQRHRPLAGIGGHVVRKSRTRRAPLGCRAISNGRLTIPLTPRIATAHLVGDEES